MIQEELLESLARKVTKLSIYEWEHQDLRPLCEKLEKDSCVQCLQFSSGELEISDASQILTTLWDNKTVTDLNLSMVRLTDNHARLIGEMLRENCTLQSLDVHATFLSKVGLEQLMKGLNSNSSLHKLDVSSNYFGAGGSCPLWSALASNNNVTPLHTLNVSLNDLTHEDAVPLADALMRNTTLTALHLSANKFGPEGAQHISKALFPVKHQQTKCTCQNAAIESLDDDAAKLMSSDAVNMPRSSCSLIDLDLSHNGIKESGATAIACALRFNKTLKTLNVANNDIKAEGCW